MVTFKTNYVSYTFLVTHNSLYKVLINKTLRKVVIKLLEEASTHEGFIFNLTVTRLTKELHYRNKSTVSRALKQLKEMELINQIEGKVWYLNYFAIQRPI